MITVPLRVILLPHLPGTAKGKHRSLIDHCGLHASYSSDGTLSCMAIAHVKHRSIDAHSNLYAPHSSAVSSSRMSVLLALLPC